jgi:hypothetical protein
MTSVARSSLWNNPDVGTHPLPDNPQEVTASINAAERCMELFPYLRIRFGERGDAYARTDSGYLTTLVRFPNGYVVEQVMWLARVLSNRGIPRWLMEIHLEVLVDELSKAVPSCVGDYGKLLEAAVVLGNERRSVVPQAYFDKLAAEFALQSGDHIPNFGGLVISAVCDEAYGIDAAVSSMTQWLVTSDNQPCNWQDTVTGLIHQARQAINHSRSGP